MIAPINSMVRNQAGKVLLVHKDGKQERWVHAVDGKELVANSEEWSFASSEARKAPVANKKAGIHAPIDNMVRNQKGKVLMINTANADDARWAYPVDAREIMKVSKIWKLATKADVEAEAIEKPMAVNAANYLNKVSQAVMTPPKADKEADKEPDKEETPVVEAKASTPEPSAKPRTAVVRSN